MTPQEIARVLRPFAQPYLLVRADGEIVGRNAAAHALPGLASDSVLDRTAAHPFLASCLVSGSFLPGVITIRDADESHTYRCEGARIDDASGPLVILRLRPRTHAASRFVLLNERIDDLHREIRERRRAEAALHAQTAELAELTVRLEQTVEQLEAQRDASDRARQAAEDAGQAKQDFLAVMSHELRTPLNAILGFAGLLSAGIGGPLNPTHTDHVARIQRSARHLLTIIEQVLTFARVEAGGERLDLTDVRPFEIAADVVHLLQTMARERGLDLRLEQGAHAGSIRSDAGKVEQILINLVSNAVKFTDIGEVVVRIDGTATGCTFEVRDTGIGIAAADFGRIFEQFTQLEASPLTRRSNGTGLGLSVCRALARVLGGSVDVESAPGEGSSFFLHLPVQPHPCAAD